MADLTTDIYDIEELVNGIKAKYVDIPDDTLSIGIYGYLTDIFSSTIENNLIAAAEYANEAVPTRAKFERNVLCHALSFYIVNHIEKDLPVVLLQSRQGGCELGLESLVHVLDPVHVFPDLLIQLCDAISGAEGVLDIVDRMSDVKRRYGMYDQGKWDRNLELKSIFEQKMGRDLYEAVEKDSFRPA